MRIVEHTEARLVLQQNLALASFIALVAAVSFLVAGWNAFADGSGAWVGWGLAVLPCLAVARVMAGRVTVTFDRERGVVKIDRRRHKSIDGVTLELGDVRRALVEQQSDTSRIVLLAGPEGQPMRHPFVHHYQSGDGSFRVAKKINAWLGVSSGRTAQ